MIGLIADLVAATLFAGVIALALGARSERLSGPPRLFLVTGAAIYALVSLSNFLEHSGLLTTLDRYEDYLEIAFVPVFVFFIHALRVEYELQMRRRAEASLAEEKERLAVTLTSIADAVVATDVSRRVVLANARALELLRCDGSQCIGRDLDAQMRLVDTRSHAALVNPVAEALRERRVVSAGLHAGLQWPGARVLPVEVDAAPIAAHDGSLLGAVVVCRDISARLATERELARVQKLEALGVLAGGIAHDFNNILTSIVGNLSIVELELEPIHPMHELVQEAASASLRARELTGQLLTFARGGAAVRRPQAIAEAVTQSARFVLRGSALELDLRLCPSLPLVDCDAGQLSQVVTNLVLNAKQAMPSGGTLRLVGDAVDLLPAEVGELPAGRYVRLVCVDDGPGIDADSMQRIFDPFFTTKDGGMGLGLAMVFSIVRQHGGHVFAASEPGLGTTMTVLLPAAEEQEAVAQVVSEQPPALSGRALVMDDEPAVLAVARSMLAKLGFEVTTASEGQGAIERFRQAAAGGAGFDLVVLDVTVKGGMGGVETVQRLRALDPEVPVLVSSGYARDPVMAQHAQYGFGGALPKPYRFDELRQAVLEVMGGEGVRGACACAEAGEGVGEP